MAHGHRKHAVDVDVHVTFGRRRSRASGPWRGEIKAGDEKDHRNGGPVPDHGVVRRRDDREGRPRRSDARRREPEGQRDEGAGENKHQRSDAEDRSFSTLNRALLRVSLEG